MEPLDREDTWLTEDSVPSGRIFRENTMVSLGSVEGDLEIRPWVQNEGNVRARLLTDDEDPRDLTPGESVKAIEGDAVLLVAGAINVNISSVEGDLSVGPMTGGLTIGRVNGDTVLDRVAGSVAIESVNGDISALRLGDDLTIVTVNGETRIDQIKGAVRIEQARGDVSVRQVGSMELRRIDGDLRAQGITALTVSGKVQGDATLADVARVQIGGVNGDLTATGITESLAIEHVKGDVKLRGIDATAIVQLVDGDLAAQDMAGGLISQARGDAFVETGLYAGKHYTLTATGIVLRTRGPINAQFVAQSNGGEISTHLPLTVERHRQHLVGVIGTGEAIVTLTSNGGDIILDAAGANDTHEPRRGPHFEGDIGGRRFSVHLDHGPDGPHININGTPIGDVSAWPFMGGFNMGTGNNSPRDFSELESRLADLGERTGRAARKAAEKAREYADRAAARARDTDWEAVSRDVRTAVERAVGELETTFREIVAEFEGSSTTGQSQQKTTSGATTQRVPVDRDPVDSTASTMSDSAPRASASERDARRRAILEQIKSGDLTLEEAEEQLRNL